MKNETNLQPRIGGGNSGFVVIDTQTVYSRYTPAGLRQLRREISNVKNSSSHDFLSLVSTIISFIPGVSKEFSLANNGVSALSSDLSTDNFIENSYESIMEAYDALIDHPDCDAIFSQDINTYDDGRKKLRTPIIFVRIVQGHAN